MGPRCVELQDRLGAQVQLPSNYYINVGGQFVNEGWRNELAAWTQNVTQRIERPLEIRNKVKHIARDGNIKTL